MKQGRRVLEAKRFGIYGCRVDASLLEVSQQMLAADVTALVVVDAAGYLCGVISQTDLIRAHLEHDDWAQQSVQAYMSDDVVTVAPSTALMEVARLLLEHHIHRVVVVQEDGERQLPVAVVSTRDLVYHMVKDA